MKRYFRVSTILIALFTGAPGVVISIAAADTVAAENQAYAKLGSAIAEKIRLRNFGLTEAQFAAFTEGFKAAYAGNPHPIDESTNRLLEDMRLRVAQPAPVTPTSAVPIGFQDHRLERYLAAARQNYSVMQSPTGLLFRVQGGTGPRPRPNDVVVLGIAANAPDGSTSLPQLSAASIRTKVTDLLPGLAEGVQMMGLGGEGFFVLPPSLSFGVGQWPEGLEPGMPLLYRVTLQDIVPQK